MCDDKLMEICRSNFNKISKNLDSRCQLAVRNSTLVNARKKYAAHYRLQKVCGSLQIGSMRLTIDRKKYAAGAYFSQGLNKQPLSVWLNP